MSGDLLEDLMSSEGDFGEGVAENNSKKINEKIVNLFLMTSSYSPCVCSSCLSLFSTSSVLASPPSVPSTQRPRLYIQPGWNRRPMWPLRRPHYQSLTPKIVLGARHRCPNMLIYLNFLQISPHTDSEAEKRCSVDGHLCIYTVSSAWARSDSSSMYSHVKEVQARTKHFINCFSKESQNKWQIIIFLNYCVWCVCKRYVCISFRVRLWVNVCRACFM